MIEPEKDIILHCMEDMPDDIDDASRRVYVSAWLRGYTRGAQAGTKAMADAAIDTVTKHLAK